MVKKKEGFWDILVRYAILILIAIPNLWVFYLIFTPLTAYPVYGLLKITYGASLLNGTHILTGNIAIELINACIAGAAYYLLLILNLSTREIVLKNRLKILLFTFFSFLIVNILRIFVLSLMAISQNNLFDITHKLFWYSLSTIFVVVIWFSAVRIFKIKTIPFYSDLKFLFKKIR